MQNKDISKELEELLEETKERDRRSFRNAIIYSLIPVIIGLTLVIFTNKTIRKLSYTQKRADSLEVQISKLHETRDVLKDSVKQTEDSLRIYMNRVNIEQRRLEPLIAQRRRMERLVAEMYRLIFPLRDMEIITRLKADSLYSAYLRLNPRVSTLWDIIREMIGLLPIPNISWGLDGISENETKFSPSGFIAYVLWKDGRLNVSIDSLKRCNDTALRRILINCSEEVRFSPTQSGDIVFYPSGNTMFYFSGYGRSGRAVCVGMTPIGLMAVNHHFEMRRGLRRIPED